MSKEVYVTLAALMVFVCSFMLIPGDSQAGGPIEPPPEIPEHPRPGQSLSPGFVTPEPPFEERIIWDEERRSQADFIPQALLDRYPLEELPLSDKQRERLISAIRMQDTTQGAPPGQWWKPMPRCSSIQHGGGSAPNSKAVSYADLILEHDTAVIAEIVNIVTGWNTAWDRVARVVYFRVEDRLRDPQKALRDGQILTATLVGGEIWVNGVHLCTSESKDFRSKEIGDRWLLLGNLGQELKSHEVRLLLPVADGYVLPQPIGRLKDREPLKLEVLEAQVEEGSRDDS